MIPLQPFMNQLGGGYYPTNRAMVYTRTLFACDLSKPVFPGSMGSDATTPAPFFGHVKSVQTCQN
jgi:hypothetical protein